ncbi:CppA C-terminal domain-containing protein, partial [Streptococcus orisratti]
ALRDYFISKNLAIYLDKKENILVISDPSQIEIWFVK